MQFTAMMSDTLLSKLAEGKSGWDKPSQIAEMARIMALKVQVIRKENISRSEKVKNCVDIANYAMFIAFLG